MKQVDAFIITSTRAPGKTRKAWYQYILVCEGHTKTGDACVRNTTGHRLVLECAVAAARELVRPAMVNIPHGLLLLCERPETACHMERQRLETVGRERTEKSGSVAAPGGKTPHPCREIQSGIHGAL